MNALKTIENALINSIKGLKTYYRDKIGNIYEFYEPSELKYQGDVAYYRNIKTGEIKEFHGLELEEIKLTKEELQNEKIC